MLYDPSPDSKEKLAKRLAKKAGLPSDDARKFLDALHEVMSEEEHEHNAAGHALSIPLVQQADGTILVDTSGYSTLWPFRRPKKPQPSVPPATPVKPRIPPGGYPGPSVAIIKVNDWLGEDLKLDKSALDRLRGQVAKLDLNASKKIFRYGSNALEGLEEE